MSQRVDARDVLDTDGLTRRPFVGQIVGSYRSTGPNPWDDYELVSEAGGTIKVLAGIEVQLERRGAAFRMRSGGRVIRVQWQPTDAELDEVGSSTPKNLRRYFVARYLADHDEDPGRGAAAVLASKLKR